MDQREEHAERWHGAIREWPGELSLAWGLQDPVATTAVLAALRELRPGVPVERAARARSLPPARRPAAPRAGRSPRSACRSERSAVRR